MNTAQKLHYHQATDLIDSPARRRVFLFFFSSGALALVYEVLWVRLLGLVFGNTTHSVAVVLAVYMAGLGLGSFFLGRRADHWRRPLRAYGWMELGIAAFAALTFPLLMLIQLIYIQFARTFSPGPAIFTLVRLILSVGILFVPTFLMGATLPTLVKFFVRRDETIGSGTALLYGLNTAGAVFGTLAAGFFLLPALGQKSTLLICVLLNAAIGLWALYLSRVHETSALPVAIQEEEEETPSSRQLPRIPSARWLPAGLLISGTTAMMYEVGWTRILGTVLGSSTYAFTLMLACFLFGIALGSTACEKFLQRRESRMTHWATLQLIIAASVLATLPLFEDVGVMTVRLFGLTLGHLLAFDALRFALCALFMLVPAFCYGALFPLSVALFTRRCEVAGQSVGRLYLFNTIGTIAGSLGAGFLLIPWLGIHTTMLAAACIGIALALACALLAGLPGRTRFWVPATAVVLVVAAAAQIQGWDPRMICSGLYYQADKWVDRRTAAIMNYVCNDRILYYKEGLNCVVSVGQSNGQRHLRVNGKVDASTTPEDSSTQSLVGHLPMLIHPDDPEKVLIVGFGSGMTLNSTLLHDPEVVECLEIEPAVMETAPLFESINNRCDLDPRAEIILNDARNHLLISSRKYDVIISEPSNPWMAGISNLFTTDFYELVKSRLNPEGIFCQWVQTYNMAPADFQMVVAGIRQVFPWVTLWNTIQGDIVLIASPDDLFLNLDRIQQRMKGSPALKASLDQVYLNDAWSMLGLFELGPGDVTRFVQEARINSDNHMILEYSSPRSLYRDTTSMIFTLLDATRTESFPPLYPPETNPWQNPEALASIGKTYLKRNLLQAAQASIDLALEQDKDNPDVNAAAGRLLMEMRNPVKAIDFLQRSSQSPDPSLDTRIHLARALTLAGRADEACGIFTELSIPEEAPAEYLLWQAEACAGAGKLKEAIETMTACVRREPPKVETIQAFLRIFTEAKNFQRAEEILTQLHEYMPESDYVCTALCRMRLATGNSVEAFGVVEDYLNRNPYDLKTWDQYIRLTLRSGQLDKAQQGALQAGKLDPFWLQQFLLTIRL
jgi:spermidine synthase